MERYNARFDVRLVTFKHDERWDWMMVRGGSNLLNPQGRLYDTEGDAMTAARVFALGRLQEERFEGSRSAEGADDMERRLVSEIANLAEDARHLKDRVINMEAMGFDASTARQGLARIESRLQILTKSLDPDFWK